MVKLWYSVVLLVYRLIYRVSVSRNSLCCCGNVVMIVNVVNVLVRVFSVW